MWAARGRGFLAEIGVADLNLQKKMEGNNQQSGVSPAKAVLLGALAPGVNGPTWITLKSALLMLGVCLSIILSLAFSSSDSYLMLHLVFLLLITATLFLLLSWFLAQTGLVSVDHQLQELDLVPNDRKR